MRLELFRTESEFHSALLKSCEFILLVSTIVRYCSILRLCTEQSNRGISLFNYIIPICTSFVFCKMLHDLLTEKQFYNVGIRKGE